MASDGTTLERGARLSSPDGERDLDLDATPWASALAAFRPVFGYAAVERRVQLARDLQDLLEPMLGVGACLATLRGALADAARPATQAADRWNRARQQAQAAVEDLDRRFRVVGEVGLSDLSWPSVDDDPDTFLATAGSTGAGAAIDPVTGDDRCRLEDAIGDAIAALDAVQEAERSVLAQLAGPLRDLRDRAASLDDAGSTCPVCATPHTMWEDTLRRSLDELTGLDERTDALGRSLSSLRDRLNGEFDRIVVVLDQDWIDPALAGSAGPGRRTGRALQDILARDGVRRSTDELRAALRAFAAEADTDGWQQAVEEAVRQSDRQRQWSRARRDAVAPFVAVWREDGETAGAAAAWQEAQNYCVNRLQTDLRQQRTRSLSRGADSTVRHLLAEAGLGVDEVTVLETKAGISVVDASGRRIELSMLSAGQRNALLLALLLAEGRAGPFGFLVLDDPVHAFDQVRVDRLARLLGDLAQQRRVIVLTHDERLREHLLGLAPRHQALALTRDSATGTVTHDALPAMWQTLIQDARDMLRLVNDTRNSATVARGDLVRGFCRMAVDNALREFVIRSARAATRDVHGDLNTLDGRSTTKERFEFVRAHYPGPTVDQAEAMIEPYYDDWNRASHGNEPTSTVDKVEVTAAERACRLLLGSEG